MDEDLSSLGQDELEPTDPKLVVLRFNAAITVPPMNRAAAIPQQVQPVRDEQPGAMHHVFPPKQAEEYRRRWLEIQAGFVDDPRNAVQYADQLVADLLQRMVDIFAQEKRGLEGQWSQGEKISTEELRVALPRYRAFFERLLTDR